MIKLYEKAIELYKNKNKDIDNQLIELHKIQHVYKTRRPEYWATTMLVCCLMPCFASLLMGIVFCTGDMAMHPYGIRWLFLGVAAFCCCCVAPFVVKHQQDSVKEYNHLLNNQNETQRKISDFKNYLTRVCLYTEHTLNNKIICRIEDEITTQKDKEALLASLQSEYDILRKNNKTSTQDIEDYIALNNTYQTELQNKNIQLAMTHFFQEEFKHDWMSDLMTGMMMSMLFIMLWDMPLLVLALQTVRPETTFSIWTIVHSVILPAGLGLSGPFIVRACRKKNRHSAFEVLMKEFQNPIDISQNFVDAQSNVTDAISELQDKISLTTLKTISDNTI